ncbi:MAG: MoxR family ATPase [bacterium]
MPEKNEMELAEKLKKGKETLLAQIRHVIVGQDEVIEQVLITLFSRGHALLVGVPGLAKTLLVSSLAEILDLQFNRIQFTPDLMPSDITGYEILQEDPATRKRELRFVQGPVFASMILADEINRTPPRTQSALLQAMQEYKVTVAGMTRQLPLPFFVIATQNPIEHEGTYSLPEAQLDRFFLQINVNYPSEAEEKQIVAGTTGSSVPALKKVMNAEDVLELQKVVRRVPVPASVLDRAVKIARMTRPGGNSPDFIGDLVAWGAGPRASQALVMGAKARCLLDGRFAVSMEDLHAVAAPILRHRIVPSFKAEAEGISADVITARLLKTVL